MLGQLQLHSLSATLCLQDHNYPSFQAPVSLSTAACKRRRLFLVSSSNHPHENHQNAETKTTSKDEVVITRKHNSKSTALLLHSLSIKHNSHYEPPPRSTEVAENEGSSLEDKVELLEMSLVKKRTPQFPGSITDFHTSSPPIRVLVDDRSGNEDEEDMLIKALEIRRKVTTEIFTEAMKRRKFGLTYARNLVSRLSDYIDHVMIQAASMKQMPEFSHSSFNHRARVYIDDSEVVPLIRWLKQNELSFPQIGNIICKSRGDVMHIRRLVEWLNSVHVKGKFIAVAMLRSGGNIFNRSFDELNDNIEYLEKNGVRRDWMGYIISRCPEILSFSMEELKTRTEFYLNFGMNEKDFGTMVFDYPKVIGYLSMEEMNQKVAYLKEFGLSNEDVGRLIAFKPHLMGCSIEEKLKPLVKFFYYLGISKEGMRKILVTTPIVFCIDLENTIVPKVQFLRDIGVQEDAIGDVLVQFPRIMTYSLEKKIRPTVIFLLTKAGVSQRNIGKVLALAPKLLGCNITHKLDLNVKYFLSLGIPFWQLGEMIADFPLILQYNIEVLRPKYQYLRRTMVRPLRDIIEFPRYFSYSLDKKIIPRHKVLVENNINFKLRHMLASTDEEFDLKVKDEVKRRQRFERVNHCDKPLPVDACININETNQSNCNIESVRQ
ncbi:unnamed protein product [Cuscuta epithymum]|uniref:Transcription termination factor MTERF2, chloroplastic n=1 Tax=Cuscuta epithymum TaxID=186058 RepID=A0AAV0ERX4_9ASTE|nr:unnamed protein product [Cuscuta epithymum]